MSIVSLPRLEPCSYSMSLPGSSLSLLPSPTSSTLWCSSWLGSPFRFASFFLLFPFTPALALLPASLAFLRYYLDTEALNMRRAAGSPLGVPREMAMAALAIAACLLKFARLLRLRSCVGCLLILKSTPRVSPFQLQPQQAVGGTPGDQTCAGGLGDPVSEEELDLSGTSHSRKGAPLKRARQARNASTWTSTRTCPRSTFTAFAYHVLEFVGFRSGVRWSSWSSTSGSEWTLTVSSCRLSSRTLLSSMPLPLFCFFSFPHGVWSAVAFSNCPFWRSVGLVLPVLYVCSGLNPRCSRIPLGSRLSFRGLHRRATSSVSPMASTSFSTPSACSRGSGKSLDCHIASWLFTPSPQHTNSR